MLLQSKEFGRIETRSVPLPPEMDDFFGTYTPSGRVLVAFHTASDPKIDGWIHALTLNDDGNDPHPVFSGAIPPVKGANGVRWMCFADNRRILLGDYVLECAPDIDRCEKAELVPVRYPEWLTTLPGLFLHWSEVIIAPDNQHICFTALTQHNAVNVLGRLERREGEYSIEDARVISTLDAFVPDPGHEGVAIPVPVRGGEVKQFVRGGRALALVGNGDSITESVLQSLDSGELLALTDTPGYEETTILSPDETLGVVMSPRFSARTNCAIFGLVPQPHSMAVRGKIINVLYMYCVAGVRAFRPGNIGPALIDIQKSRELGRGYMGVNLSDPEGKWVYYSPISWHPSSTRALWNERTRPSQGKPQCRLRMCRLLDRKPGAPVPPAATPGAEEIPYALPPEALRAWNGSPAFPLRIRGKANGWLVNEQTPGEPPVLEARYDHFSDDGKTFYHGTLRVAAPESMFAVGKTVFEADLNVTGAHEGEMKLRAVFARDGVHAPARLSFDLQADGLPESRGWAAYDGVTLRMEDMEP